MSNHEVGPLNGTGHLRRIANAGDISDPHKACRGEHGRDDGHNEAFDLPILHSIVESQGGYTWATSSNGPKAACAATLTAAALA
jgi:hypothetical protein